MDHLSFKVIFEPPFCDGTSKRQLAAEALINRKRIIAGVVLPVDIHELVASTIRPGNYFVWTSSGDVPECAGIYKGVRVRYTETTVRWKNNDTAPNQLNELEFDRAQYMAAIETLWRDYAAYCKAPEYEQAEAEPVAV